MSREEEIRSELFDHTLNRCAGWSMPSTARTTPAHTCICHRSQPPTSLSRRGSSQSCSWPRATVTGWPSRLTCSVRPLIAETGAKPIGKVVIGTVKGDIHDIGKNLVIIMMEGAGFDVVDLGVNVAPEKFVAAVQQHEPHIVGFSAFLTTTMPMFKVNIEALQKASLREKVHVMVGGAPVTEEYARQSGADTYSPDAS
ncbi:MAG: hypothetical protein E6I22_03850, partial [Chloroflexi bacterium]